MSVQRCARAEAGVINFAGAIGRAEGVRLPRHGQIRVYRKEAFGAQGEPDTAQCVYGSVTWGIAHTKVCMYMCMYNCEYAQLHY